MTISERNRKGDAAFSPVVWEKKGSISRRGSSSTPDLASVFRKVFLPAGYPQSVRPEYLQYQLYDSLQGLCSYLRAVLCYRGIFAGAGVGDAAATPLAAALGWVLKDGVSICGSLIFAYFYAESFEVDIKEWRLLADVLNNIGLTLDLLTGWVGTRFFFALASMSALAKALCGLVAGATKARIAEHFARDGHLADVVSKEGTQETAVSLVGLLLGMAVSQLLSAESNSSTLVFLFVLLTAVHQWANWKLVKVLVFDTLSSQKLYILADELHRGSSQIRSPQLMTAKETLWRPIYLGIFGPSFGGSLQDVISASSGKEEWSTLTSGSWVKYCILGFDRPKGRILVCLPEEGEVEDEDDDNKDGVEVKKIIAHLIGFYVFCVVRELQTRRIGNLDTPVSLLDALPQLSKAIPEIESLARGLSSVGWTITKGSSRLGEGAFRYRFNKKKE